MSTCEMPGRRRLTDAEILRAVRIMEGIPEHEDDCDGHHDGGDCARPFRGSTPPAEEMRRWLTERIAQAERLGLHDEKHAYMECLAHMEWVPGVLVREP